MIKTLISVSLVVFAATALSSTSEPAHFRETCYREDQQPCLTGFTCHAKPCLFGMECDAVSSTCKVLYGFGCDSRGIKCSPLDFSLVKPSHFGESCYPQAPLPQRCLEGFTCHGSKNPTCHKMYAYQKEGKACSVDKPCLFGMECDAASSTCMALSGYACGSRGIKCTRQPAHFRETCYREDQQPCLTGFTCHGSAALTCHKMYAYQKEGKACSVAKPCLFGMECDAVSSTCKALPGFSCVAQGAKCTLTA
jgi:hypothetical protein